MWYDERKSTERLGDFMDSTLKRTWAEIDLDALAHNYTVLRNRICADVKFLGVVKRMPTDTALYRSAGFYRRCMRTT